MNISTSSRLAQLAIAVGALFLSAPAFASMVITPTFTANFNTNFGANAVAAQNSWIAAASVFTNSFSDNIHVNITVDAIAGTSIFGQSNTAANSTTYVNLRALMVTDAKTADDATAIGAGGSLTVADPTGGNGTWWVSRAQAKAIGLIADDLSNDGQTTFGTGHSFTFSGSITPGTYDFQAVAAHEISEVLGRLGISGDTVGTAANSYSLFDAFSYTGAGTRGLGNGGGNNFSIDNGTTLLKAFNNAQSNGLDSRDWAPGTNDAFNQFGVIGVVNPVSQVGLQSMDVIGYDRVSVATTPEPATGVLLFAGLLAGGLIRRRTKSVA
jgi:hypothetical protein